MASKYHALIETGEHFAKTTCEWLDGFWNDITTKKVRKLRRRQCTRNLCWTHASCVVQARSTFNGGRYRPCSQHVWLKAEVCRICPTVENKMSTTTKWYDPERKVWQSALVAVWLLTTLQSHNKLELNKDRCCPSTWRKSQCIAQPMSSRANMFIWWYNSWGSWRRDHIDDKVVCTFWLKCFSTTRFGACGGRITHNIWVVRSIQYIPR